MSGSPRGPVSKRASTLVLASARSAFASVTRLLARVSSPFLAARAPLARDCTAATAAQPGQGRQHGHRRRRHRRPIPLRPPPSPPRERLAIGRHRLVGRPPFDVVGQRPAARVAVFGLRRHRLQADGLERGVDRRVDRSRTREIALADGSQDLADVVSLERRLAGEQAIKRRAQAVNVGTRAEPLEVAGRLLGAHIRRASPSPSRGGSRPSRWPTTASASARPTAIRAPPSPSPWPGPSRPPAFRHICRR